VLVWKTHSSCDRPTFGTWLRGFLSTNFCLRWARLMYMGRSQRVWGPKIVCIVKSFQPMFEMMLVALVLFSGFGGALLLMNEEKSAGFVVLGLFKALFLGDGDSFNQLHELRGADVPGAFPAMLITVACMVFTICVLPLLIAIYSNEYNKKEELSSQLFVQERAAMCFECLLHPRWPGYFEKALDTIHRSVLRSDCMYLPQSLQQRQKLLKFIVAVVAILVGLTGLFSSASSPCCAAGVFASLQLLLQTFTLRSSWLTPGAYKGEEAKDKDDDARRFFLWICYSKQDVEVEAGGL